MEKYLKTIIHYFYYYYYHFLPYSTQDGDDKDEYDGELDSEHEEIGRARHWRFEKYAVRISERELNVNISERWSTAVKGIHLTGKIYIQTQRWTEEVGAQVHGEPCRCWQVQLDTKKNSELGSVKVEQEKLREVFFFLCFVRLKVISDNILHIVNREKQLTWDIHILLYFCIKIRERDVDTQV